MPANPKKELANYDRDSFLTKQEVATLFKVTPGTVDNWKKAGLLHPLKMGHFLMFPKAEIEGIINGDIEAPFIYKIVDEADRRELKAETRRQVRRLAQECGREAYAILFEHERETLIYAADGRAESRTTHTTPATYACYKPVIAEVRVKRDGERVNEEVWAYMETPDVLGASLFGTEERARQSLEEFYARLHVGETTMPIYGNADDEGNAQKIGERTYRNTARIVKI